MEEGFIASEQVYSLQDLRENKELISHMISALCSNNLQAFTQFGTENYKKQITSEILSSVSNQLKLSNYELIFLGTVDRKSNIGKEFCWKLINSDSKEMLIRLFLDDGQVSGFFIQ